MSVIRIEANIITDLRLRIFEMFFTINRYNATIGGIKFELRNLRKKKGNFRKKNVNYI